MNGDFWSGVAITLLSGLLLVAVVAAESHVHAADCRRAADRVRAITTCAAFPTPMLCTLTPHDLAQTQVDLRFLKESCTND